MNTLREELIRDMSNMEDVMCRTAERADIWQDRCVYAMAKALYHIIAYILRKEQ